MTQNKKGVCPFNSPAGEILPSSYLDKNKNTFIRTFVGSLTLPRRLQDFFSNYKTLTLFALNNPFKIKQCTREYYR